MAPSQILLDQMGPQLDLAGCWRFPEAVHIRYRVVFHHLILVEQGGVKVRTPLGEFEALPGELLCLRPARWSEYWTQPETLMHQITLSFAPPPLDLATPLLPGLGLLPMQVSLKAFHNEARAAFETIRSNLPQSDIPSQLRCKMAVYQILETVASALTENETKRRQVDEWDDVRLKLTDLNASASDIATLAREMGYSPQHFRRLFKRHFGINAQQCKMMARLHAAQHRLHDGQETIKSIAFDLGFAGAKGLTRAIQKHLGLTASAIRLNPELLPSLNEALVDQLNVHVLPPGKTAESLMKRYAPKEERIF